MQIISFDIGIKNLAYCILSVNPADSSFTILDWNVLNLLETNTPKQISYQCTHSLKPKKGVCNPCGKTAILKHPTSSSFFCPRHSKSQDTYLLPTTDIAVSTIKKHKMNELKEFAIKHKVLTEAEIGTLTKPHLLEKVLTFFESRRLVPIPKIKVKNANQTDLVQIGKCIKMEFAKIDAISNITHVLIENQISTVASRMKTIQGMVAQYFIMVLENPRIEFISSSNKLKNFVESPQPPLENTFYPSSVISNEFAEDTDDEAVVDKSEAVSDKSEAVFDKKVYKKHKSDGVKYCLDILRKNQMTEWSAKMIAHKKQDDLADCFLQGYWYIHKSVVHLKK